MRSHPLLFSASSLCRIFSLVGGQSRRLRKRFLLPILSILVLFCPGLAGVASAGVNTWTTNGPEGGLIAALAIDPATPATLYAGTSGAGVFKSSDGGGSWTPINAGLTSTFVNALAIDPLAPATLYAGTDGGGVFKSTNGGGSWTVVNTGLTNTRVFALAIDPSAPATLYAGTFGGGGVFKSTNGGGSWAAINAGLIETVVWTLAIDPSTPSTLYAGTYIGLFRSINGGESWRAVNREHVDSVFALAFDPSAPATVYSGWYDHGIFKSTNGGESWATINAGLTPDTAVFALAIDPSNPGTLYAGTEGGVFKSTNAGGSWIAVNSGLTNTMVYALAINPSAPATLYAGTFGGGVFDYQAVAGSCAPGPTTLCLNDGRFQVQTHWIARDGSSGPGQARAVTGDAGFFTFFDPANVEMMVKILNGCSANGSFWTFAGGLTDVSVVMTVTDSQTGVVNTYANPQGTPFQPIQDVNAFAACAFESPARAPATAGYAGPLPVPPIVSESFDGSGAPCVADATTLCLNHSRYQVRAQWVAHDGASGEGQVINLTGDTGAFWFFSPSNVEMVIKVLNGCGLNSRYWTFAGGLTDVNVILRVTDTETGTVKTYTNPQGTPFQPIQDTIAFATCP